MSDRDAGASDRSGPPRQSVGISWTAEGVSLRGPLSGSAALAAQPRMSDFLHDAEGTLRVDLSGLTALDSLGLRLLLEAAPQAQPLILEGLPLFLENSLLGAELPDRVELRRCRGSGAVPDRDRRSWPRFVCALEVSLELRNGEAHIPCRGLLTDVGEGGGYVEFLQADCRSEELVGSKRALLRRASEPDQVITAQVVRTEQRRSQLGLGLDFQAEEAAGRAAVRRLVEQARSTTRR